MIPWLGRCSKWAMGGPWSGKLGGRFAAGWLGLCLALYLSFAATLATAGAERQLLQSAQTAYEATDYQAALKQYEALSQLGIDSPYLAYNIGNCHMRLGQVPQALARYRQAAYDLPRNANVRANLRLARQEVRDAPPPPGPPVWLRGFLFWHFALNPQELFYLAAVVHWLWFGIIVALPALRRRPALAGLQRPLLLSVGSLWLLLLGSLAWHTWLPGRVAVIVQPQAAVHTGSGSDTAIRFRLSQGAEAEIRRQSGSWLHVVVSDGREGWIYKSDAWVVKAL